MQTDQSTSNRDFEREIEDAIRAAQRAAGFDFLGTLTRLCLLPALGSVNETDIVPAYIRDPGLVPPHESWYAEAAQVFDNLYFVGGKVHSAWAIATSQGFILLDTIYPYNSEELIVGGMQRLGLNSKDIKYVVISHAHGDHIGGAEMLQRRGARIVMDPVDWDMLSRYPKRYTSMSPRRDIEAYDGMPLTLGDTTVTLWRTPGHTPGTLSFTFTVFDRGQPLSVVYSGGTALNFPCSTPDPGVQNLQIYINSQRHIAAQAAATGARVLLSNHSEFDNATTKVKMLAGRGNGPNPFDIGSDLVRRYFEVTRNGARAAQIGLERVAATASPSAHRRTDRG